MHLDYRGLIRPKFSVPYSTDFLGRSKGVAFDQSQGTLEKGEFWAVLRYKLSMGKPPLIKIKVSGKVLLGKNIAFHFC